MLTKEEFLREIPKTDLHVHLDGSLRLSTLIDLAKEKNVTLPSYTEEGMRELVFKDKYESLDDYLKGFSYTGAVMNTAESLERIAYEFAFDNFQEGVRYVEVRFAPQLHINDLLSFEDVVKSIDRGMRNAATEINKSIPSMQPEFRYGLIVCAMRYCNANFSSYYKNFFDMHKYSSERECISLASLELAKATVKLRDESDIPIVGFDIAGSEWGHPADEHKQSYDYVHKHFLHKTVHAGEASGPESIFSALTSCHADRIGHGLQLFREDKIIDTSITDKKSYISGLVNFLADSRITIEICLTSNLQTMPELKNIKEHSLSKMLDKRLSVSVCTDNRLVSNTSVCKELKLMTDNFNISEKMFKDIVVYGFKRSFFYGSYSEKREYVRKCIAYYESIAKKYSNEK
jgi:adenosine deaminase